MPSKICSKCNQAKGWIISSVGWRLIAKKEIEKYHSLIGETNAL